MSTAASPFHAGELAVQERMGVREQIAPWAQKVVRPFMPEQHREFYRQLPFAVVAARDAHDRPWVTLLADKPGFIEAPNATTLLFKGGVLPGDALAQAIGTGSELGLLGIELETRRRNRMNGTVTSLERGEIRVQVQQSFGNCPQYITERKWRHVDTSPADASSHRHTTLTESMVKWIQRADTFFIGSGHRDTPPSASSGMDASHRGGPPGFVEVSSPTRLIFPDYAGNNHFNTLGNLVLDPRVALLFVDFETGGLLQITGRASIDWDSPAVAQHDDAKRLVTIDIDEIVELSHVLPLRFSAPQEPVRELRLVEKRREADDVVSFYFESRDGGPLKNFRAGQHLPIELDIAGQNPVTRTYSMSNGPRQAGYRISVKREPHGLVSRLLHDTVEVGSILNSKSPAGDFVIPEDGRSIVLIGAGIGVTPLVSMLHELTEQPSDRPIVLLHGARDGRHHPLAEELRSVSRAHDNVTLRVAYSQPRGEDTLHKDYDVAGRIDARLIRDSVPDLDASFFLCGPQPFLAAMADILSGLGVREERIHVEEF